MCSSSAIFSAMRVERRLGGWSHSKSSTLHLHQMPRFHSYHDQTRGGGVLLGGTAAAWTAYCKRSSTRHGLKAHSAGPCSPWARGEKRSSSIPGMLKPTDSSAGCVSCGCGVYLGKSSVSRLGGGKWGQHRHSSRQRCSSGLNPYP